MTQFKSPFPAPDPRGDAAADGTPLPVLGESQTGSRWGKAHHILLFFAVAVLVLWLLSGFYKVETGKVAVVERLGEFLRVGNGDDAKVMQVEAGLHYHLPWPIDSFVAVPVEQTVTKAITDFNTSPEENDDLKRSLMRQGASKDVVDAVFDPYLITGDKNIVHAQITLTYRVKEPEKYLTCVFDDPRTPLAERDEVIRQLAAHELIRQIARHGVDDLLTTGKDAMQVDLLAATQQDFDEMGLGILIQQTQVNTIQPPLGRVNDAFNDVTKARSERAGLIANGGGQRQSAKIAADEEAKTILNQAEGYRTNVVRQAEGEKSEFTAVYDRYLAAPELTKANLFFDTMTVVMASVNRILWVQPGETTFLTLPPVDESRPVNLQPVNGGTGGPRQGG